eukprot:Skav211544  [mRNA]  locus=scaffold5431:11157:19385:- [translate_table: standard]
MVNQLQEQNELLKMELEALKRQRQTPGSNSASSWTTVTGPPEEPPKPMTKVVHSPPRHDQLVAQSPRFTPNGTRVPDGPPPDRDVGQGLPQPPELPPFPIPKHEPDSIRLQDYEVDDSRSKGRLGEPLWRPTQYRTLSADEARTFWLEKEVVALQRQFDQMKGDPMFCRSSYWSMGVTKEPHDDSRRVGTEPDFRAVAATLGGAASGVHGGGRADAACARGETHEDGRADVAGHGEECHGGRANPSTGHDGGHGDGRASMEHGDQRLPRRAELARDKELGDDRALHAADQRQGREDGGVGLSPNEERPGPLSDDWVPPEDGGESVDVVDRDGRVLGTYNYGRGVEPGGASAGSLAPTYAPIPTSWEHGTGGGSRAELPVLPGNATPLQFGDWLHLCGPTMRDISSQANVWWEETTKQALKYYNDWKCATPLQKIMIDPQLPVSLRQPQYGRTEQRGVHLLLKAIAEDIQQTIVTDRQLSSTAILFRLYARYQPGGPGEKSLILKELCALPKTPSIADLAQALRGWRRHFGRAREVQAALPDGVLLLKALESASQQIAKLDSQAAFRLAQSRSQLQVDEQPTETSIWAYSQCLLAEAETLVLMASTTGGTADQTAIKVRQLDGSEASPNVASDPKKDETTAAGKGKGGALTMAETPCKWFRSDQGCRAGKQCKWSHSWEGITDKASRCWTCGSKEHRKNDCKLRGGKTRHGEASTSGGGNVGGNKSTPTKPTKPSETTPSTATSTMTATPGKKPGKEMTTVAAVDAMSDVGSSVSEVPGGASDTSSNPAGSNIATALLQEATTLLKAMRGSQHQPNISVIKLAKLDLVEREWILLDSGATHALRPALSEEEWLAGDPTQVTLADGSTTQFRLKDGTRILMTPPGDSAGEAWIVPMGGLADLGYEMDWKGDKCSVRNELGEVVPVTIRSGCPMFPKEVGKQIIMKLEQKQIRMKMKLKMLQTLMQTQGSKPPDWNMEMALTVKLKHLFPKFPEHLMMELVPDLARLDDVTLGQKVPWNRRIRRRLESAQNLVIHLYAGKDAKFWTQHLRSGSTEVLCIDILDGFKADMLDDATFTYVIKLVMTGRVRAIIGGPPCRTVSALRYQQDGGPRAVRNEEQPYGLSSNTPAEQRMVDQDSLLWMRMLALYVLAEEIRDGTTHPPTAFAVEQPEDPRDYRDPQEVQELGFMSMWRTDEWLSFEREFNMKRISFDQGCMGHLKRKPTTLGTNLMALWELDGMRGGGVYTGPTKAPLSMQASKSMKERCAESKTWAEWAPGLKKALAMVLQRWLETSQPSSPRRCLRRMKPLTQEQWRLHFENDHLPARRDCRHCVQAQARSRPHHRVRHAESFTLSVDLSGKLTPGEDQCTKGSKQVSYLMVATYTFPTTRKGEPVIQPPGEADPVDHPLPPLDADLEGEGVEGMERSEEHEGQSADHDQPPLVDPEDAADGWEEVEPPPPEGPPSLAEQSANQAYETWHKLIDEASDVRVQTLTFAELLPSRSTQEILPALARIYCRLRSLGLPVYRLHSDRAREFVASPIRRWCLDRGIIATLTPGSSWKSNGRAEAEVGVLKRGIRTLINADKCDLDYWPLAARHVAERRLRCQLQRLGWPTGSLLAFGTQAFAVRKWWQSRYEDWRDVREPVTIMGPDASSSLTHTAYYVKSTETGHFFYTDDVVTVDPRSMASDSDRVAGETDDNTPIPYLPVREDGAPRRVWPDHPYRRIRGKTTMPDFAMHRIAGEEDGFFLLSEECSMPYATWDLLDELDAISASSELNGSGHSWTLQTAPSSSTTSLRSLVEDEVCGGEQEGVPNNREGGSRPMTPFVQSQVQAMQVQQANLHHLIEDELQRLDGVHEEQAWCLPVISQMMHDKNDIEDRLLQQMRVAQDKMENALETEFLVTKTISNKEVWSQLESWRESIVKEYDQLVHQKRAVVQMTRQQLNQLAQQRGLPIELLPGKTVHTRKSGTGQYKTRAVVCGNFGETDNSDHYASGCDGVQVRAMIRCAALRQWKVGATDIRTAFLNAPKRSHTRLTAMEIPAVMKHCGLAEQGEVWLIEKALYGLTTSPKDWGIYRDEELPKLTWTRMVGEDKWHGTFQKTKDENLWMLLETKEGTKDARQRGMMSVYVDDLLLVGEEATMEKAFEAVTKKWETTPMEWATADKPVKYCGFEVYEHPSKDGFLVNQSMYEAEMLAKWGTTSSSDYPGFRINEDDFDQVTDVDAGEVKRAQAMAGSLLWLATRTRPDLSFGVMTLCQLRTRNPKKAQEVGEALLRYVKGNPSSLHYPAEVLGGDWGPREQLKVARNVNTLEVYSDIAFATSAGHKSVQGIVIYLAGAPIAWQANRQPFCCHSTAEAELVSLCEALMVGKATEALLLCMIELEEGDYLHKILYGDNMASISLGNGTSTSWRTRHLRIRSSVLKEATGEDLPETQRWHLLHLKGSELVSDGLTKPLAGQAFRRFLEDLGLTSSTRNAEDEGKVGEGDFPMVDHNYLNRVLALVIASLMIQETMAESETKDSSGTYVFYGGIVLMMCGAMTILWMTVRMMTMLGNIAMRWRMTRQSGLHQESATARTPTGSSGSQFRSATSRKSMLQSGSDDVCASTSGLSRRSGFDGGASSRQSMRQSGFNDGSASTLSPRQRSGLMSASTHRSGTVGVNYVGNEDVSMTMTLSRPSSSTKNGPEATSAKGSTATNQHPDGENDRTDEEVLVVSSDSEGDKIRNPWNRFQHKNRGRGWTVEQMVYHYRLQEKNG